MLRRTRREMPAPSQQRKHRLFILIIYYKILAKIIKKSKKRQFSSKSKNRYNKVKSIPQTESRNVTGVENSKDKQKFISSKDKQKTISRDHSDMAYMDEDKGDEVLLGDAFFKKETDAEPDNTDTEPDNTASEQRFFPRRKNRRQNDFPSFELFRPFFDDFHAKPERPSPPPRRFRPRPPSSHEFHYDGSDNSILGSGNFIVLPGGTFKDYADYHDDYYYNNEYRPYRPEYNGDFFANFKDFADINAHRRHLINVRNDKF